MKIKNTIMAGHITLGNTVDVTDPCYDKDVWCRCTIKNVAAGKYACYAIIADEGSFGQRVAKARIVLDDGSDAAKDTQARVQKGRSWRYNTTIGVDAGVAGFFADKPDFDDDQWSELCDWMFSQEEDRAFVKRFDNETDGFWTSSGYGDGCYDVCAIRSLVNGKPMITALEIRFL